MHLFLSPPYSHFCLLLSRRRGGKNNNIIQKIKIFMHRIVKWNYRVDKNGLSGLLAGLGLRARRCDESLKKEEEENQHPEEEKTSK